MTVETKCNLNEKTLEKMQDLIRINVDSDKGFREAAEQVDDALVAQTLRELAEQRVKNAVALQNFVSVNGEEPAKEGSFAAKLHRTWIDIRGKLNGGEAHVVLCEAERGEDVIKAAYEDALKETAGSAVNDLLTEQYADIKRGHDRIRDMRDARAKK